MEATAWIVSSSSPGVRLWARGCWPSGYSDTQSEAVRATNLAQMMIYERYNSDGTVEFQQLDDPHRGEAGGRGALRRLDPANVISKYTGMLNLETIGGTTSSALICTRPHWESTRRRALGEGHLKFLNDRRGGYSVVVFRPTVSAFY